MKLITPNLIKFSVSALILTFVFRIALSHSIVNELVLYAIIIAVAYGIGMYFLGFFFGKKDYEYLPIYDIGFRFHAATYFVFCIASELWFQFGKPSENEPHSFYRTVVVWGIFLLIHLVAWLLLKKRGIKNLDKTALFE